MTRFSLLFLTILLLVSPHASGQQALPLGPYGNTGFNSVAFTNSVTIPAQQMVGLTVGTPTVNATYTTDTATNICALWPQVGTSGSTNFAYDWYIKNASLQNNGAFIGIVGGSGVTMIGAPVVPPGSNTLDMKIQLTNCTPNSQAVTITPINPVPAFRIQQFGSTTATTASAGNQTSTTLTWQVPMPDTSYVAVCNGVNATNTPALSIASQTATTVVVQVTAITSAAASYANVNCIAWHL